MSTAELKTLAIAGASGVVGRHLLALARREGLAVRVLTRGAPEPSATRWDPSRAAAGDAAALAPVTAALEGADLVVNLAGASLDGGRLSADHKRRVLESRLDATRALVRARARCAAPPPVWINASAVGYYGETGDAEVTEESPQGAGFLAAVCQRWEEAAREAAGARVVLARIGLVLADDAPAWRKLVQPIRWGVGGRLGSGEQWWAWIDADDLARGLLFLARTPEAEGAFNLTAPHPVRQADLTRQAARLLRRPAFLPAPAFALRAVLGEVADALLLPSCRALPRRLEGLGFTFQRAEIGLQLEALLGAGAPGS